jgi:hypothetical protein
LLSTDPLPKAEVVAGPAFEETWAGAEAAVKVRLSELEQGRVQATGLADEEAIKEIEKQPLIQGFLRLPAKCDWCEYGALCGKVWEVKEGDDDEAY